MTNNEKLVACYGDLLDTLYDYTGELVNAKNDDAVDSILGVIERLTTNLKRLGETQLVETIDEDIEKDRNIEEAEVLVE